MLIKLKKMTVATLQIILVSIVCIPAVLSCATVNNQVTSPIKKHTKVPVESFAFIEIKKEIKPSGCSPQEKIEECKKFVEELPIVSTKSTGSGILMSHKGKKFVITAAHVCLPPPIKQTEYRGFLIDLSSSTSKIKIRFKGNKSFDSKILKADQKYDVCILAPPEDDTLKPVFLSPNPPQVGDKIINLAAPLGIFGKNLTLIFDGK